MAQSRNRPPRLVTLIVIAVLALLAALAGRAGAQAIPDDGAPENDDDLLSASPPARERDDDRPPPCDCASRAPIPVHDVVAAAYRAAGIADDPAPSWRLRSRLTGLVPQVSGRVGQGLTWKEVDDPTLGHNAVWDVHATWRLDRLLFEPNEIRIAAIDVSRRRDRRRVSALAIHTYYDWLALDAAGQRSSHWAMRAEEVLAVLDAMTDGWFSQERAKRQKQ